MPPYEQIRHQVTALVLGDHLRAGDRLPSIRQLAGDLGLAGGTVARAYRELEDDGVVRSRGARGTTIVGPPALSIDQPPLLDAAMAYAEVAERSGASLEQAIDLLRIAVARRATG